MSGGQRFPEGRHALRLGDSFFTKTAPSFHTLRYDFKPASVGDCKETYVEVAENQEVTVTVPKLDDTGEVRDATMFKGPRKPYQKECLLIYNHETGEFVLEQLTYNIQLKKTRGEVTEEVLQNIRETRKKLVQSNSNDHASLNGSTSSAMIVQPSATNGVATTAENDTEMMSDSDRSHSESDSSDAGSDDDVQSDAEGDADDGEQYSEDELAKHLEAELSSSQKSRHETVIPETSSAPAPVQNSAFQPVHRRSVSQAASSNLQQDLLLSESSDEED